MKLSKTSQIISGVALLAMSATLAAAAELTIVTVATPGAALHFYPSYVADKGGFLEKEGIKIEWVTVGSGSKQVAAVASGSADMAVIGMQPAITASENGANLIAFAKLFDTYPLQLVLSKAAMAKTGISPEMAIDDKVARLKDLTIAVTGAGSSTDVILRSWLMKRGVAPDAVLRIQPVGSPPAMMASFERGLVDGFVLSAPFPEIAEKKDLGRIVIDPLKREVPELTNVPYTAMITNRAYFDKNPDVIARFTRALAKAMKHTRDDPAAVAKVLKGYFPDTDQALFDKFEPMYRAVAATTPVISRDDYSRLSGWIAITAGGGVKAKYEDFVRADAAEKAAKDILK